jgi:tRNA1Val (adenine37-N6)-methyltransferase
LRARGLAPARLRFIHPREGRPATRVLVEAVRGGRAPLVVEPPLVVHESTAGELFTPEVRRLIHEEADEEA